MEYSNSGYLVLTAIIEKRSGLRYEDFLRENIFTNLGMNNSGVDTGREILKNRAEGYTVWEKSFTPNLWICPSRKVHSGCILQLKIYINGAKR